MSEQDTTALVAFRLPETLKERVEQVSKAKHFTSISEYARDLVRRDIEQHEESGKRSNVEVGA